MIQIFKDHNGLTVFGLETGDRTPFKFGTVAEHEEGHFYTVKEGGAISDEGGGYRDLCDLAFQNGPILTSGVNGLTNEALLAIVIHRTTVLNDKFPCKENVSAIQKMEDALAAL